MSTDDIQKNMVAVRPSFVEVDGGWVVRVMMGSVLWGDVGRDTNTPYTSKAEAVANTRNALRQFDAQARRELKEGPQFISILAPLQHPCPHPDGFIDTDDLWCLDCGKKLVGEEREKALKNEKSA